mmetsp:Transcript_31801/g.90709  ORF Transcript_31801/g.90709 Transcript_31801/m.90709 type:complete len:186 (+) Transcript_31801:162-719(+)|eukprot:CAMPEP_0176239238 /NCGR_PEP_ID=MMETSP0121_2-20121125/28770_1 /TAXON_ID=160619 /ORGANISM="Kryptoperidinium foliaceum, Strain CCMP 1326" /LENGTH=185 /DNA_ID=CAMNT_0017578723 /DNA_START=21 /DNA_END=578 /DNA_ORIENTATION=+
MGSALARAWRRLSGQPELRVVLVGLPGAGKTTLLHRLGLGELVTIIPTIGWNVETVERGGCSIIAWDLGVPDLPRPHLLSRYTYRKNGLVFVVDSADPDRFQEARTQLDIAHFDELEYLPLLVFANKQDLPSAATAEDVAERLGLHRMQGRKWFVQSACAASGVGLSEGMAWLSSAVQAMRPAVV